MGPRSYHPGQWVITWPLHDDSETEDNVVNESEVEWLEDDEA